MLGCARNGVGAAVRRFAAAAQSPSISKKLGGSVPGAGLQLQLPSVWRKTSILGDNQDARSFSTALSGMHGVFGLLMGKGIIGMTKFGAGAAGERSVGTLHRGKLRGNIKEAWEHREVQRLTAARDPNLFDDFDVGDHVVVRHVDVDAPGRFLTFGGVCIGKYGGSKLMRSFRLRNHVDGVGVEMHFAYFAPHIKGIQLLKKKTRTTKRAKWYFLREKPPKEYTVAWKEKDLKLPRPPKV